MILRALAIISGSIQTYTLPVLTALLLLTSYAVSAQTDTTEIVKSHSTEWAEVLKYKIWDQGLLIKVENGASFDTLSLKDIITGVDQETSFLNQRGEVVNYTTFRDKVVLLDFWFLQCPPCLLDLPMLDLLQKKVNAEDVVIVTFTKDSLEALQTTILSKKDLNFNIITNTHLIGAPYPYKLVLDSSQEFIDSQSGGSTAPNSIQTSLEKYLSLVRNTQK